MTDAFKKFDLTGKTALVTGGATGLGYYMARGLMRSGAQVMVVSRRENLLKEAATKLRSESQAGEVLYRSVDLNNRKSVSDLAEHAIKTMGGVDIFIGNAGQDIFEKVDAISDAAADQMFQVNLFSSMELLRAFLPGMRGKKWGRVMFSSSTTSLATSAQEGMGVYTATKGALNSFAKTAATETGHDGITVNSILFGIFMTPMTEEAMAGVEKTYGQAAAKAAIESWSGMTAIGRWGRCDEVEGLIQFLASDAGSYVTGSNLVIDGGLSIMAKSNPSPESPVYPPLS